MRRAAHRLATVLGLACGLLAGPALAGETLPEYRLKAAILYNFALFTEWPAATGNTLNLCIVGRDPFGPDIDALQGKAVGGRAVEVQRKGEGDALGACQITFLAPSVAPRLPQLLDALKGRPVLTVADTPGAGRQGAILNLAVAQGRVTFEANLASARGAGLVLSSKLLRLATEVHQ